jgi:hypothetical protein
MRRGPRIIFTAKDRDGRDEFTAVKVITLSRWRSLCFGREFIFNRVVEELDVLACLGRTRSPVRIRATLRIL